MFAIDFGPKIFQHMKNLKFYKKFISMTMHQQFCFGNINIEKLT